MNSWDLLQLNLRFYESITQNAERALAEDKLDVKSFFLLASIEELKHPAALAKRLTLPKPTVTFLIKKLEQALYVKRKTVEGDLRFRLEALEGGEGVEGSMSWTSSSSAVMASSLVCCASFFRLASSRRS